jgi:hydroxyacylglutathione hydrolase
MKIERFETPGLAQYAYIVSSDGEAVVIDPMRDTEWYTRYLANEGLVLTAIVETHIHADFASGATALAKETGAELALSGYDEGQQYRYEMPHRSLRNGDAIKIGSVRLEAMHTPGHTPEHLSFLLFDTKRSMAEPLALFSGDFLFVGSLGRPDLLGEEAKQGLAHELFRSLHRRLDPLPDGVQIYPGHGAGSLCGAGMDDRPESTLGYERRTNPLFRMDEASFIAEVLGTVPHMPSYYPRMKELNSRGAASIASLPQPKKLSPSELEDIRKSSRPVLLDLRRPQAFGGAHVPGSINIGAGQNLSLWAGWLLDPESQIVLIDDTGEDQESQQALMRVGLDHVLGSLAGGMPAWIDAGLDFAPLAQISTAEVERRNPDTIILDVRSDGEWRSGHIEGAKHIMLGDLPAQLDLVPGEKEIITVCGSGYRSSIAASLLLKAGFTGVKSMDGGMGAWKQRSRPVSMTQNS